MSLFHELVEEDSSRVYPVQAIVTRKDGSRDSTWFDLDSRELSVSAAATARFAGKKDVITGNVVNNIRAYIISEETAEKILNVLFKNGIYGGYVQFKSPWRMEFGVGSRDDREHVQDFPDWIASHMALVNQIKAKYVK